MSNPRSAGDSDDVLIDLTHASDVDKKKLGLFKQNVMQNAEWIKALLASAPVSKQVAFLAFTNVTIVTIDLLICRDKKVSKNRT